MSLANISTLNEVPPSTLRPKCSPFEYELISQLKLADLPLFCQQNGLILGRSYDSGNISLRCKYQSEGCPYLAYFASQFDAIYGTNRQHNYHNIGNLEKNKQKLKPKIVPPSIFRPNCSPLEYEFISNMTLADLPLFCQQNGFTISDRYQSGNISLRCKHSRKSGCLYMAYFAGQFNAIYGSKCRQHNHRIIGNLAKNKQTLKPTFEKKRKEKKAKIDTDQNNNWRYISHVKSRQEMDEICQRFGLNRTILQAKCQKFECKQHTKYRKTKRRTTLADCGMRGILLNSNSCFYLIGKHNHHCNWANEEGEIGVNGIMEEANGNEKNVNNIADEIDEDEQDEEEDEEDQADSRSCLGFEEMDEEHKSESEEDEPDYMDNKGKIWTFFANIQNKKELEQVCRKNGLTKNKTNNKTINYVCTARWSKNCQFRGIFIKTNSCLYVGNCHNHQLANSSDKK